eukprot:CAMPEP_0174322912 /NCGR_PEP_ID=MMETSP0810-20121108/11384_1 /TAXON_ID=73025 ORGANISM="Eutreptiella gymnastica-like, Strain CCMP1594" /NCGR_SAMPLE_ID=MMETSP0810 /ASSEMBLY_ACC=CAM_ASM_000659 /LENGTH=73 /DNA_ID=CAMNT_0015435019 /DNA_START=811 /DNA_END=1032 /DNA_ORIENTATION=+
MIFFVDMYRLPIAATVVSDAVRARRWPLNGSDGVITPAPTKTPPSPRPAMSEGMLPVLTNAKSPPAPRIPPRV